MSMSSPGLLNPCPPRVTQDEVLNPAVTMTHPAVDTSLSWQPSSPQPTDVLAMQRLDVFPDLNYTSGGYFRLDLFPLGEH
ncbi:hypothetical protein VM1G_11767 [Cytospora mali]|uniref:Uncharacterized protein n=1 Tax=Cytospora mali TaxID=578113 RepID=A0A194W3Z9_CYTMA|nr:hypothetical protein VM1G_11767 [Valsa mali]